MPVYLYLDIFTLLFPLLLSFDKKVYFFQYWKGIFVGILCAGIPFLIWDYYFTQAGVWGFNQTYLLGISAFGLPIEEISFFVVVPFACTFIYECLKSYFPKGFIPLKAVKYISFCILTLSLSMFVFQFGKLYSSLTFGILSLFVGFIILQKPLWIGRFYDAFGICIIPFAIVNGVLTSLPIVWYNPAEFSNFRWGSIPFEDSFYQMVLMLIVIAVHERFIRKVKLQKSLKTMF